jgi:hypothetical protein
VQRKETVLSSAERLFAEETVETLFEKTERYQADEL